MDRIETFHRLAEDFQADPRNVFTEYFKHFEAAKGDKQKVERLGLRFAEWVHWFVVTEENIRKLQYGLQWLAKNSSLVGSASALNYLLLGVLWAHPGIWLRIIADGAELARNAVALTIFEERLQKFIVWAGTVGDAKTKKLTKSKLAIVVYQNPCRVSFSKLSDIVGDSIWMACLENNPNVWLGGYAVRVQRAANNGKLDTFLREVQNWKDYGVENPLHPGWQIVAPAVSRLNNYFSANPEGDVREMLH